MAKKLINMMVTTEENALLASYARQTGRTKTDVIRELIRSLKSKIEKAR